MKISPAEGGLRILNGDNQRISLTLTFSSPRFFGKENLASNSSRIFGWLDLIIFFWGGGGGWYSRQSEDSLWYVLPAYRRKRSSANQKVQPNMFLKTLFFMLYYLMLSRNF